MNSYADTYLVVTFKARRLSVLEDVYKSEAETNQRNQAIAMLMYAYGRIKDNPQLATDIYTRQCSVGVNAKNLATMARALANGGRNQFTGKQVISGENVPEILAVMATAGLYDDSGRWLYGNRCSPDSGPRPASGLPDLGSAPTPAGARKQVASSPDGAKRNPGGTGGTAAAKALTREIVRRLARLSLDSAVPDQGCSRPRHRPRPRRLAHCP
jgi:hypothetical protein